MFTLRTARILARFSASAYLEPHKFLKKYSNSMHFSRGSCEAFITFNPDKTVITFRGTQGIEDILVDASALPRDTLGGQVHSGFFNAIERICGPLKRALDKHHVLGRPIYVTGHSKGGAEAQLFASRIALLNNVSVYTFGAPRVSDKEYCRTYNEVVPKYYSIINDSDPVPRVPKWFKLLGQEMWLMESGEFRPKPNFLKRLWWFIWDTSRLDDHSINSYLDRLQK